MPTIRTFLIDLNVPCLSKSKSFLNRRNQYLHILTDEDLE